jgi:predicted dehydrogenase
MKIERILIVGLGSIGKKHLSIARSMYPEAKIMVLRHSKSNENFQTADFTVYNEKEAIDFNPQISVICTPSSQHLCVAMALAKIGSHLLIEKPISNNTKNVRELVNYCKVHNRVLLVGYNLRYLGSLLHFKNQIESGCIGKILAVKSEVGQYLPSWRKDSDYRTNVSANSRLGGGVLLELSHEIDYLRWIFGEIIWVRSTLAKLSSLEIDVEDYANLTLGIKGSEQSDIVIGNVIMDFFRHDDKRSCFAIGELGTLMWDGIEDKVLRKLSTESDWTILFEGKQNREESYTQEWKALTALVENERSEVLSGDDGLAVLKIIDATRRSAKKGRQINVKNPSTYKRTKN